MVKFVAVVFTLGLALAFVPPKALWRARAPFLFLNWLQWFLASPLRRLLRNHLSDWPRRIFFVLAPLGLTYAVLVYFALLPVRLINAYYFDIVLFWSVSMYNGWAGLTDASYSPNRFRNTVLRIVLFPWRLVKFLLGYVVVLVQGMMTFIFDLVWPTLTLFHGTDWSIAANIAQTGQWLAGSGDYAGTGIYFGLRQEIADHYAQGKLCPIVVVARVTLTPCRPISTLPDGLRQKVGHWQGDSISQSVQSPWATLEHWRSDCRWYEFCVVQPSKYNVVSPWRIRPICIVRDDDPERVTGGPAIWPRTRQGWTVLACTFLAISLPLLTGFPSQALSMFTLLPKIIVSTPVPATRAPATRPPATRPPATKPTASPAPSVGCPGAPPSRLRVGMLACVENLGQGLNIRSAAKISPDNVVVKVHFGDKLTITGGPTCADNHVWWKVKAKDGKTGWVAEGRTQNYFIRPCNP